MVLTKLQPNFGKKNISPNHVEHALRIWTIQATFRNPDVMSGQQMKDFLLNSSAYASVWGKNTERIEPLLVEQPAGFSVRYGRTTGPGGSVHHDHTLACLTEAGISLDEPVFLASGRQSDIQYMLEQALRDFQFDERETEWSTLAFALWVSPTKSWQLPNGRTLTFDMLADRLIRGQLETGVCSGTHRLYTLMAMWRINQAHNILSEPQAQKIFNHLAMIRDSISQSQFPDGHWPSNWCAGKDAVEHPVEDELPAKIIATGHHLEWLAIAPEELHPTREIMEKAAQWCIQTTRDQDQKSIYARYTFFTHVGNALALWRKERPHSFYHKWELAHPELNSQPTPPPPGTTTPAPELNH
jgi:hypothetical protein